MSRFPAWTSYANAYLPLSESDKRLYAEARIKIQVKHSATPVFDSVNTPRFWFEFYANWTRDEMMEQARVLGLHTWKTMPNGKLMGCLINYWIDRMNELTK
jgi:hypothetical protein